MNLIYEGKDAGVVNLEYNFEVGGTVKMDATLPKKVDPKIIESKTAIDGALSINIQSASLQRDVDVFTKMDPLCEFQLQGFTDAKTGKSDFKTKTH